MTVSDETVSGIDSWRFKVPIPTEIDSLAQFRGFWNSLNAGIEVRMPKKPQSSSNCREYIRVAHADGSSEVLPDDMPDNKLDDEDFVPPEAANQGISTSGKNSQQTSPYGCQVNSARAAYSSVSGPLFKTFVVIYTPKDWQEDMPVLHIETTLPPERTTSQLRKGAYAIKSGSDITFSFQRATIDGSFLKRLYFVDWNEKEQFDKAFPELNSIMTGISTLEINDALHRVESQAAAAERTVSVLGLTIPLTQLSRWGALVLIWSAAISVVASL